LEPNELTITTDTPVARTLWKLPAGLGDQDAEEPLNAARLGSAENKRVRAATWRRSAHDLHPSPGISTETVRAYLVTDRQLREDVGNRAERDPISGCFPLGLAVLTGAIMNDLSIAGVLAACARASVTCTTIRPADVGSPLAAPSGFAGGAGPRADGDGSDD
jgi:hypothetical protein